MYTFDKTRLELSYNYATFTKASFSRIDRDAVALGAQTLLTKSTKLAAKVLDNKYHSPTNNANNLNYGFVLYQRLLEHLTLSLDFRHYDMIDMQLPFSNQLYNGADIGSAGLNIKTTDYKLGLFYNNWQKRISIYGDITYGKLSDHNRRISRVLAISYRLTPMMRAEYSYFYLDYANPSPTFVENNNYSPAYFDPINYEAHTVRLVLHNPYPERWLWGLEGDVSYIAKNSSAGESIFAYLGYKLTDHFRALLNGRYSYVNRGVTRSGFNEERYWANNIIFSLQYHF